MKLAEDSGMLRGLSAARRVLRIRDFSTIIGSQLVRYGGRSLAPALALSFTLLLGNKALGGGAPRGLPFTPLAISTILIALGLSLKILPALFTNQRILSVEARGFNNLENYRKARLTEWLERIWERVFRHQAALCYGAADRAAEQERTARQLSTLRSVLATMPPELHAWLGAPPLEEVALRIASSRSMGREIEASLEGFLIDATYAMKEPVSETEALAATGYDLSMLGDFLDGAPFRIGDDKLKEHHIAHPILRRARKRAASGVRLPRSLRVGWLARRSDLWYFVQQLNRDTICAVWRRAICREVMIATATAIQRIESRHPGALITAQSLLRPGDAGNAYHRDYPGLPEDLQAEARKVMRRVFGKTGAEARSTFERFGLRSLVRSTRLRILFDPDYLDGSLGEDLVGDIRRAGGGAALIEGAETFAEEIRASRRELEAQEAYQYLDPSGRLFVRLALHLGMIDAPGHLESERIGELRREHETAVREELRAVRLHQTLAWMEHDEHWGLIIELGGYHENEA